MWARSSGVMAVGRASTGVLFASAAATAAGDVCGNRPIETVPPVDRNVGAAVGAAGAGTWVGDAAGLGAALRRGGVLLSFWSIAGDLLVCRKGGFYRKTP